MSLLLKCLVESMTSDAVFALEEFTCLDATSNFENLFRSTGGVNTRAMYQKQRRTKGKVTLNAKAKYKQESLSVFVLDLHYKLCEVHYYKAHQHTCILHLNILQWSSICYPKPLSCF